jgi:hypothetical protein
VSNNARIETPLAAACLRGALRLCDELLQGALQAPDGLCWATLDPSSLDGRASSVRPWLYDGNAGLCWLLGQAFRAGASGAHREGALASARWLLSELDRHPEPWTGFFSGWTGVLFAILSTAEACGDARLLEQARQRCRALARGIARAQGADWMEGTAGALLGTLVLMPHAPSEELRQTVGRLAHRLVEDIDGLQGGLFWGTSSRTIRPLAGLAHGASGIAFSFALHEALGGGDGSAWLRDQALAYEDTLPRRDDGAWPDLRLELWSEEDRSRAIARLRQGDLAWFSTPSWTQGWCHGGGGIGLARLHLGLALQRPTLLRDASVAGALLARSPRAAGQEWSLCHGLAGDLELFDELARHQLHPEAPRWRAQAARLLLEASTLGLRLPSGYNLDPPAPCPSLFLGVAGVASALLRVALAEPFPSILLPGAPLRRSSHVDPWSLRRARSLALARLLPRSLGALVASARGARAAPVIDPSSSGYMEDKYTIEGLWREHLGGRSLPPETEAIVRWEARWIELDARIKSRGLLLIREALRREQLRVWRDEGALLPEDRPLFPEVELCRVEAEEARLAGVSVPEKAVEVVLFPGRSPGSEVFLGAADVALLDAFAVHPLVREVLLALTEEVPTGPPRERARAALQGRIRALLQGGLLWFSPPPPLLEPTAQRDTQRSRADHRNNKETGP